MEQSFNQYAYGNTKKKRKYSNNTLINYSAYVMLFLFFCVSSITTNKLRELLFKVIYIFHLGFRIQCRKNGTYFAPSYLIHAIIQSYFVLTVRSLDIYDRKRKWHFKKVN